MYDTAQDIDDLDLTSWEQDLATTRALYGDVSPDEEGDYILSPETIFHLLKTAGGNTIYAASLACGAIAGNEAYLLKNIRTDDLSINGASLAAEWRLRAKDLYEQYMRGLDDGWALDIGYLQNTTPFKD